MSDERAEEDVGLEPGQFLDAFVAFVEDHALGQAGAQGARGLAVGHGDMADVEARGVAQERIDVAPNGEAGDLEARAVGGEEAEGRLSDRAGGAEDDESAGRGRGGHSGAPSERRRRVRSAPSSRA